MYSTARANLTTAAASAPDPLTSREPSDAGQKRIELALESMSLELAELRTEIAASRMTRGSGVAALMARLTAMAAPVLSALRSA